MRLSTKGLGMIQHILFISYKDAESTFARSDTAIVRDSFKDACHFCPPLDIPSSDNCKYAANDLQSSVVSHSKLLKFLWWAALYTPDYWHYLFELAQTALRVNCVIAYLHGQCFTSVLGALHQLERLCTAFRDRVRLAAPALEEEDSHIFRNLVKQHRCYGLVDPDIDKDGIYKSVVMNYHLNKMALDRAMRTIEGKGNSTTKVPRWSYPEADSWSSRCKERPSGALYWWEVPTILSRASSLFSKHGYVVNIGANTGECNVSHLLPIGEFDDPANCLAGHGYGGVFIEGNSEFYTTLLNRLDNRDDIEFYLSYVEPTSISSIVGLALQRLREKRELAMIEDFIDDVNLLKVDVDNCDCCFVEELLADGLRPRLIHAEVHQLIPPPIAFKPQFRSGTLVEGAMHQHCSLAAYMAILQPYSYHLSHMNKIDAVFVRSDLLHLCPWILSDDETGEARWTTGYHCHPLRPLLFESYEYISKYVYDFRRWSDTSIPLEDRLELIHEQMHRAGFAEDSYSLWLHRALRGQT